MLVDRSRSHYNSAISRTKAFDPRAPPSRPFTEAADRYGVDIHTRAEAELQCGRALNRAEQQATRHQELTRWVDETREGPSSNAASRRLGRRFDVVTGVGGGETSTGIYDVAKQEYALAMRADPFSVTYARGHAAATLLSGDLRGAANAVRHMDELAVMPRLRPRVAP